MGPPQRVSRTRGRVGGSDPRLGVYKPTAAGQPPHHRAGCGARALDPCALQNYKASNEASYATSLGNAHYWQALVIAYSNPLR